MAQNQQAITVGQTWTQLTNADATTVSFQVVTGEAFIRGTTDATTPTADYGFLYQRGAGENDKLLSDLFSGAGIDRLWAKCVQGSAVVMIDHA